MKVVILQDTCMVQRRFHQRLGAGFCIFIQKMPLQRPGIHPDPHRTAMIARGADNLADTRFIADIAGIDPQTGSPGFSSFDGALCGTEPWCCPCSSPPRCPW